MRRILLDSVASTNDYALRLLETERPEEGTIVQARLQSRGRGQMGARWQSEPGRNLTVSIIFYPTFLDLPRQFGLARAMALAVADCVSSLTRIESVVKWPNDVLLEGRKVAGILIENRLSGHGIRASVVGVGLNVNQRSFPPGIAGAGSIATATGVEHDLEQALELLHAALLARYAELRERPTATEEEYLRRLHAMGKELDFTIAGQRTRGTIVGVDEGGRLLVRLARGETAAFRPKEIAYADLTSE